jgi:hypothetical protein
MSFRTCRYNIESTRASHFISSAIAAVITRRVACEHTWDEQAKDLTGVDMIENVCKLKFREEIEANTVTALRPWFQNSRCSVKRQSKINVTIFLNIYERKN